MRLAPVCGALLALALAPGCSTPTLEQRHEAATPAVRALQRGRFDLAGGEATRALGSDGSNPYARLVRAIVTYRRTMHQLWLDGRTVVVGAVAAGGINDRYARAAFEQAEADLGRVENDLDEVAREPGVALELCPACWEIDWNGDGRVVRRDRLLFQIEIDANGDPIPEGDPRRKPTFRFDRGDVAWARAFVSFQRAALDLLLAYDLADAARLAGRIDSRDPPVVIRLSHPERVAAARRELLRGLDFSAEARREYLAETDDDREWVPNPRQRSHPLPLPVDDALYETWEQVVADLRRLASGEEGLGVADLAQLGDHRWESPPAGYVDVGRMLAHPRDIVIHPRRLRRIHRQPDVEAALAEMLGDYYVRDMRPSPLPGRLRRMKAEVDRGEEAMGRKLRYLLWIN
jgi:hypothetical protein